MKLRELILRITGICIMFIILALILGIIAYREKHKYTYVIDDKFYKSDNCYIHNDFRVCEVKNKLIAVDYYYEEVKR